MHEKWVEFEARAGWQEGGGGGCVVRLCCAVPCVELQLVKYSAQYTVYTVLRCYARCRASRCLGSRIRICVKLKYLDRKRNNTRGALHNAKVPRPLPTQHAVRFSFPLPSLAPSRPSIIDHDSGRAHSEHDGGGEVTARLAVCSAIASVWFMSESLRYVSLSPYVRISLSFPSKRTMGDAG